MRQPAGRWRGFYARAGGEHFPQIVGEPGAPNAVRFLWPSPADGVVTISPAQLVAPVIENDGNF
jgi:hypothetical protein